MVVAIITLFAVPTFAATGTWTGNAGATWDTGTTNWSNLSGTPWDVTNGGTNTAVFNASNFSSTVNGGIWANAITFNNSGTVSSGTITLVGSTPTITATSSRTATIGSTLAGSAGLTITGGGTLALNGANTYSGTTSTSTATLVLGNASALGTSVLAWKNLIAATTLTGANRITNNLFIPSSNGTVTISGSNAIDLSGTATFNGAGVLNVNNTGATTFSGPMWLLSGTANQTITFGGTSSFTISGAIGIDASGTLNSGWANLRYVGTGTMTLSGANTFGGNLSAYSGGVVGFANASALGNGNPMQFGSNGSTGTLIYTGVGETINKQVRVGFSAGDTGMRGILDQSGSGLLTFGSSVTTSATNAVTSIATGTLVLQGSTSGTGRITGAVGQQSSVTLGVVKQGSGVWQLAGANTFSGATSVTGGRLEVTAGNINSSSGITVNGANAEFRYNSSTALSKPLTLTQGILSGTGRIDTAVSIGANAILSPGNSPGTQTYQSGTFAAGGSYTWEINNWTSGTAGVNFDQAIFTNGLAITSSTASPFTINLTSLKADNSAGAVPNFNNGLTGLSFTIATGSMTGYSPSVFALGTSSFFTANTVSGSANGGFWLSTNSGSDQLILNYAPSARYTLSATPAVAAIYAGGTTTIIGSIANSTADRTGADAMQFSNFSVGTGSLSITSGTIASGAGTTGSVNFSSGSAGQFSFTPTVSATNVNLGTAAVAGTVTSGTVTVWNPAAVNTISPVTLGNVRVSGTFGTVALTIKNTAAGGSYTEVLGATGSTSGIASLTGSVSSLAGGSTSTAISVGLGGSANTSTAGVKSGTAGLSFTSTGGPGTASIAPQTVAITGTVWNYAAATITSGTSINFGTVLTGTPLAQALSITNSAPTTFSERLDAAFGTLAGGATTNSGSFSLLVAGSTSAAMSVGLDSLSAGGKSGSVQVNFTSNGDGTSGLGTTSLASQTVSLVGTVLDPATASLVGGSTAGSNWLLNLGEFQQGSGTSSPMSFGISNLTQTAGYTADLFLASFSNPTSSGAIFTNLTGTSSFATLNSGSMNSFTAWMSLATTGTFTNIYNLSFNSSKNGTSLGGTPQNVTLTVTGVIVVPEPGAMALACFGIAAIGWSFARRRCR